MPSSIWYGGFDVEWSRTIGTLVNRSPTIKTSHCDGGAPERASTTVVTGSMIRQKWYVGAWRTETMWRLPDLGEASFCEVGAFFIMKRVCLPSLVLAKGMSNTKTNRWKRWPNSGGRVDHFKVN